MSNAKHMVFIEQDMHEACLTCCFALELFVTCPQLEKGDEEKMRTNIDQTNGMLTSSIAHLPTHNVTLIFHFFPKTQKQFPQETSSSVEKRKKR